MDNSVITALAEIRENSGKQTTTGITDESISRFADLDPRLGQAVAEALAAHRALREKEPELLEYDEIELIERVQDRILSFYADDATNPYVPLAACGPWLVTCHGAVLHDSGGYGMLGLGHCPEAVLEAMSGHYVMANVMSPSVEQLRFTSLLDREVGHTRGGSPYTRYMCLNSGSESVALACRIADINSRVLTDPDGRFAGRRVRQLSLHGSFHGRTARPARVSDSTRAAYVKHLASFRDLDNLIVIDPNDTEQLTRAFEEADRDGVFIEAVFLEPVQGEGNPGLAVDRPFYDLARRRTLEHGGMLIVDSIQAGLRATGMLSIVDYPGFETCEPPDMETWSKALNAGQYPLSVLALGPGPSDMFVRGLYGNTMTTNPRAMAVGCSVLEAVTPELRTNIRERGREFVEKFEAIASEFPLDVTGVQGKGLLFAISFDPERIRVTGADGLEQWCRRRGIGVIHGGPNALRFTPNFGVTTAEVDLIVGIVREGVAAYSGHLSH